jgi:hypothetical protein
VTPPRLICTVWPPRPVAGEAVVELAVDQHLAVGGAPDAAQGQVGAGADRDRRRRGRGRAAAAITSASVTMATSARATAW